MDPVQLKFVAASAVMKFIRKDTLKSGALALQRMCWVGQWILARNQRFASVAGDLVYGIEYRLILYMQSLELVEQELDEQDSEQEQEEE